VQSRMNANNTNIAGVQTPPIILLKEQEIRARRMRLNQQVKEMMDSSMVFNQLKMQPKRLLQRKQALMMQAQKIEDQIRLIDENVEITNHYLKQEENTMKINQ